MIIEVAKHAGFCAGVARAVKLSEETLNENKENEKVIYSFGDIVHNKDVTGNLEASGLIKIESLEDAKDGSIVIVRAHGAPERFYHEAESRGIKIVDATCSYVKKIQALAKEAYNNNLKVVIVGDKNHPEVIGINGFCNDEAIVVGNIAEAETIEEDNLCILAQTTITLDFWEEIKKILEKKSFKNINFHKTICSATIDRQNSCETLSKSVDAMVVIGDKRSSNSYKLYKIAKKNCENSIFIERKHDLPLKDIEKCNRIGIAAGASTPACTVKEVIATMSEQITEMNEMNEQIENPGEVEAVEETVVEEATEAAAVEEATEEAVVEETTEATAVEETTEAAVVVEEATEKEAVVEEAIEAETVKEAVSAPVTEEETGEEQNEMHALMDEIEKSLRLPGRGEIVQGTVVQVTNKEIVVNIGCKKDGILPKDEVVLDEGKELTEMFQAGDAIEAKVIKTDDGDGNLLLSKKKLEVGEHWEEINNALDSREFVEAKVVKEVKGGVIAVYKEVSGFIPMSQLSDRFVENANEFMGKTLPVRVTRVDQKRNKAVFSHKDYLMEERSKKIAEIWESLKVGDVTEGTVMRFTDYGAFVDIGGIDGLLHISEISWGKLKHPQEALKIGEKVKVKILAMNPEKDKISLGMKQNTPEPWENVENNYKVGDVVDGKIVQIKEYGAFVELEPGLDGLVHISEIAHKRVGNIADEVQIGQTVQTKILEIDKEKRRINLSIKETLPPPSMESGDAEEVEVKSDKPSYDDLSENSDAIDTTDIAPEGGEYEEAPEAPEATEEADEVRRELSPETVNDEPLDHIQEME